MKLEDHLRDGLRDRARRVLTTDEAWSLIERGVLRRRNRQRAARIATAAFALVLSASALTGLVYAFGSRDGALPLGSAGLATAAPAVSPHVAATIKLPGCPLAMDTGEGYVWLGLACERTANGLGPGELVSIDPQTNTVQHVAEGGIWAITVAAGSVWATGALRGGGESVQRIDPATGSVLATIPFPEGIILPAIVGDDNGVWVEVQENRQGGSLSLSRIDPQTDHVVATIPLDNSDPTPPGAAFSWNGANLTLGEGAVWATVWEQTDEHVFNGFLLRIDPATNQITGTVRVGQSQALAIGDGAVWTNVEGTGPVRIDTQTLDVQPFDLPVDLRYFEPFAVDQTGIWVFDRRTNSVAVARLDPRTLQVNLSVTEPSFPSLASFEPVLDSASGAVWVPDDDQNQITRVDVA